MSKHTPGPWSVDDYGAGQRIVVKGRKGFSGDYRVADAHFSSDLVHCVRVAEMQANARLIAAAPELLDALKALDAYWSADFPEGPDGSRVALGGLGTVSDDTMDVWRTVRAAIAKSGGQP